MRRGDRVLVTVRGARVRATVLEPLTALGNVQVELDEPIDELELGSPVRLVVRQRSDVDPVTS